MLIAAGIPIRFELANIVNTNTASNTVDSITTKDTNGAVIDGPTNSVAYPIRQITSGDIADNAITTNKIANRAVSPDKISQTVDIEGQTNTNGISNDPTHKS